MSVAAFPIAALSGPRHNQRVQIFSGLGTEEMSRIAPHARSLRRARGEFIYLAGDRADVVYILKRGRIKLSVLSETGKEIAIDIIQPGMLSLLTARCLGSCGLAPVAVFDGEVAGRLDREQLVARIGDWSRS